MSKLHIITNGHRRELLYGWELTDRERAEFDWIDENEQDDYQFFRYKGWTYCLADFMRTNSPNNPLGDWDGYHGDSFFSGILVRYPIEDWGDTDFDHIIVGWYYS